MRAPCTASTSAILTLAWKRWENAAVADPLRDGRPAIDEVTHRLFAIVIYMHRPAQDYTSRVRCIFRDDPQIGHLGNRVFAASLQ